MNPNLKYYLAVNKVTGLGTIKIKNALDYLKDIKSLWHARRSDLFGIEGFNEKLVDSFIKTRQEIDPDNELEIVINSKYKAITFEDEEYPINLKNIYDPPPIIYIDGKIRQSDSKAIAIVGTRKPTYYGKEIARDLAKKLSGYGFTIISGLAIGIDAEAHMGALDAGGRTISVYGSGIDQIYPPSNRKLANTISENGANISEFPIGFAPDKWTFPQRNRIISGLSLGVVVVEGGLDSGALITAKIGLEQGREVFAVPGNVKSEYSRGPHSLLKQGAKLVESIDDILDELKIYVEKKDVKIEKSYENLTEAEKKVISVLSYEPGIVENVVADSGLNISETLKVLSILEMKRYIKQLPGKNFVLI